jgi:hypothetical protein
MINTETLMIDDSPTYVDGIRYLKTKYQGNKERFLSRFVEPTRELLQMEECENYKEVMDFYVSLWDLHPKFSYQEAFEISDNSFSSKVFSVINVPEMIENLGTTRIKTEGIELINRVYNEHTQGFDEIKLTQIYELHNVNSEKLGLSENSEKIYAIKCWCTSTEEEHWLWVDNEIGKQENPLEAIASTCKVYKSMLGNIKHIIRQGDVFLFEMIDDNIEPKENEEVVPLDSKTYFKLLKSQS